MNTVTIWKRCLGALIAVLLMPPAQAQESDRPLRVCVSSTDVRALVEAVGGNAVDVTGFVKGADDPHVVAASRGMIEALSSADLLIVVGNGLEEAWLPDMLAQARNSDVLAGGTRHLDLSENLRTIAGPEGRGVPSSFHPEDNPHFLIDPVEGVKAAGTIAAKLSEIDPVNAVGFEERYRTLASAVMTELFGEDVASAHTAEELEELSIAVELGEFAEHLKRHGKRTAELGGQLAAFEAFRDTPVVGDHDLWPYLARRYGVRVLGYLEPSPGVPPTTRHLTKLISEMKARDARVILTVTYFDPRHARFVAEATDSVIVPMANNPGSRPETGTYLEWIRYNGRVLLEALSEQASKEGGDD